MQTDLCILCGSDNIQNYFDDHTKQDNSRYFQCENCRLIFTSPKDRPTPEEEFGRYETHENDPDDEGYRNFLSQLFEPLNERIDPASKGLDFGSGPGPTLNIMFEEEGHEMHIYDPFYDNNPAVFDESYDFITATEVVEHLFQPGKELQQLWNCLRPGGYLGIMTKIAKDDPAFFADWHYRLDLTHVTFYTKDTFRWLAKLWDASLEFPADRVIIFQKPE